TLDAPEGAVDLLMLDGRRVRARPMGIAYTEFQSGQAGKSVFVAEIKGAAFDLSGRSEVTYPDALSGAVSGSIRYRVSIGGLEQDVLLASTLPPPSRFQMNEALVRAEIWNEILESPPATRTQRPSCARTGAGTATTRSSSARCCWVRGTS